MRPARRAPGLTAIEAMVVIAIMGILLGVGMPAMSNFLLAKKAGAALDFYRDGLVMARNQAIAHNSASRLVLTENPANGQMDWQVDLCFPDAATRCDDASSAWSTPTAAASGDPDQSGGFRSVARSAATLPSQDALVVAADPDGAAGVYFTPLGWVDATVTPRVQRIAVAPAAGRSGAFPRAAVAVTLAGMANNCDPAAAAHTARACPP